MTVFSHAFCLLICSATVLTIVSVSSSTSANEIPIVLLTAPIASADEYIYNQRSAIPLNIPLVKLTEKAFSWSSSELIDDSNEIIVEAEEGYFISVEVVKTFMSDGNYLLVQAGNSDNPQAKDRRIFTTSGKKAMTYLYLTSQVYAFFENTKPDVNNTQAEFTVVFKRIGEITTTTTSSTTTTISVPPTSETDSTRYTVSLGGRPLSDFKDANTKDSFQSCVAQIAQNYCKQENILLTKDITKEYVIIDNIDQCPYDWPYSSTCVQVTFRLPIFYDSSSKWNGYQINSHNLEIMWLRKDEFNSTCLYDNNFNNYDDPNFKRSIIWWGIGIAVVIVAFVALLWFLRTFNGKLKNALKKRVRRLSDTASIVSRKTDSVCSLTPHYLQDRLEVPKFFED